MARVTDEEFERLVVEAVDSLPPSLLGRFTDVVIDVEARPTRETARRLGFRSRRSVLGLFHGVPLTEQSVTDSGRLPSRITIYRNNIRRVCRTRRDIVDEVRRTVLHEIGHHFGLDETDLAELGFD